MEILSKEMRLNLSFLSCVESSGHTHGKTRSPQCLSWSCCVRMEEGHKLIKKGMGVGRKVVEDSPTRKNRLTAENFLVNKLI